MNFGTKSLKNHRFFIKIWQWYPQNFDCKLLIFKISRVTTLSRVGGVCVKTLLQPSRSPTVCNCNSGSHVCCQRRAATDTINEANIGNISDFIHNRTCTQVSPSQNELWGKIPKKLSLQQCPGTLNKQLLLRYILLQDQGFILKKLQKTVKLLRQLCFFTNEIFFSYEEKCSSERTLEQNFFRKKI